MEKGQGTSRMRRLFTGIMTMFMFAKHAAKENASVNKGGFGGSGNFNGVPYFPGKQVMKRHFNKKRNGKHLRAKHRKAA